MKFMHHGVEVELPDDWWDEAGMGNFVRNSNSYRVGQSNPEQGFLRFASGTWGRYVVVQVSAYSTIA
jgi:hypothetical protein